MTTSLTGNNNFPKSFGDSRDDLGYGRLTPKYFLNRVQGSTFPYIEEPPELENIDIDDEIIMAVQLKMQEPRDYDPLPNYSIGAQSLTSPRSYLGEASTSISPIPDLYKNRSLANLGTAAKYPPGPTSGFSTRSRPTGDRYGYSTMYGEDEEGDIPAYSLEDIAEKQIEEIRTLVRLILLENK